MPKESWVEWRAVYRVPASWLDTIEDQKLGWIEFITRPFKTKEEAKREAMFRSEETLAFVVKYECREVTASNWHNDTTESYLKGDV